MAARDERMPGLRNVTDSFRVFLDGCESFGRRAYWERAWIVQELWLGSEVLVLRDVDFVHWEWFRSLACFLSHQRSKLILDPSGQSEGMYESLVQTPLWSLLSAAVGALSLQNVMRDFYSPISKPNSVLP